MPFAAEFIFIIMDVNIIVVGVRWCGDYSTEETEPEIGSEKNKDKVCDCGSMCMCMYVCVPFKKKKILLFVLLLVLRGNVTCGA